MLFDRDEMQLLAMPGIVAPSVPYGEKIVAQPESGFDDDVLVKPLPSVGKAAPGHEHMPGLAHGTCLRVIDVPVGKREGGSVVIKLQTGGLDRPIVASAAHDAARLRK